MAPMSLACTGLSFFPCKPRMTTPANVSQGQSACEEDDEGVECCLPSPGPGSGLSSAFPGDVAQAVVDEFHVGVVGWEVSARLGDFAELEVDGFDGVLGVDDAC